jgi:O-acetylserine/cysteine efflux transporter
LIKAGLDLAPPLRFAGLRALLAGIALLAVTVVRHEPVLPPRRVWLPLIALSLVATTMAYAAMFLSPGRTGAGIASVLGNAQPLVTVGLAAAFLSEHLTRGKAIALGLGIAGVVLIAYPVLTGPDAYGVSGALLALGASVGSAAGAILVKRMGQLHSLMAVTAWSLILGSLPLLLLSWNAERDRVINWNLPFIGLLLFLALAGTAFASFLWYWLVQREDLGRLSLYLFLVPVLGLTIAALVYGERIGLVEGLGVALATAGIGAAVLETRVTAQSQTTPDLHAHAGTSIR